MFSFRSLEVVCMLIFHIGFGPLVGTVRNYEFLHDSFWYLAAGTQALLTAVAVEPRFHKLRLCAIKTVTDKANRTG